MPWEKGTPSLRPERSREPGSIPGGIEKLSRPFRPQLFVIPPPRASACGLSPGLGSPGPLGRRGWVDYVESGEDEPRGKLPRDGGSLDIARQAAAGQGKLIYGAVSVRSPRHASAGRGKLGHRAASSRGARQASLWRGKNSPGRGKPVYRAAGFRGAGQAYPWRGKRPQPAARFRGTRQAWTSRGKQPRGTASFFVAR